MLLPNYKKEWSNNTHNNMDETWKHVKWKKPYTEYTEDHIWREMCLKP
jgi:hypothetical protein